MKRKQKRQKRIDLKKETEPGTLLFAFLGVLQVMLFSPPVRKGGGEEAEPDSTVFSFFLTAAREPTRRQWRWCVDPRAGHCSYTPRSPSL